MITRDEKENRRKLFHMVNASLKSFEVVHPTDTTYVCLGYDILRWAAQGLLTSPENETDEFVNWYPGNAAFVILRLARQGKLTCSIIID